MKLTVLYGEDGRIVSLSRSRGIDPAGSDGPAIQPPRSGVQAGRGQHVAIIDVPEALRDWSVKDMHRGCSVVRRGDVVQIVERPKAGQ